MKCPSHLSLEKVDLAPSAEWRVELHGWCLFRVSEGQGYWLDEGAAQEADRGDVFCVSPLHEGFFRASQLGLVAVHYFRFSPDLVTGLLTPAERDGFERPAVRPDCALRFLRADTGAARIFGQICSAAPSLHALGQRCELLQLVSTIFADDLAQPLPAETKFLSARQQLKLLMNQLSEAELLDLTAQEMAIRCGCSLTHFTRSFRKLFGVSLREKQEIVQLHKARQMLVETTSSLETIATEAGYVDVKELGAAFQRRFGVTPMEWRHPKLKKIKAPSEVGRASSV